MKHVFSKKTSRRDFLKYSIIGLLPPSFKVYAEKDQGDVYYFFAQHKQFEHYRKQVFNKRITLKPLVIAVCFSEQGVIEAVNDARKNNLAVSVKSGGHSFEGFCLNNNGMVIDLSNMRKIVYQNELNTIIEPGCKLAQIYDYLLPKKRIIPMGSCGNVGVAGLTLGGGYGLFSRQYGLTCDSLRDVRLVNGKGELITSDNDKKLLWACRGGGNGNFGIVTQFNFKTFDAPKILHSRNLRFYNLTTQRLEKISEQWFAASATLPNDTFSAFVLNGTTLMILVTWLTSTEQVSKSWSTLITMADKKYKNRTNNIQKAVKRFYGVMTPIYFKNASAGYYQDGSELKNILNKIFTTVKKTKGVIYQINTMGGKISDHTLERTAAYPHRKYNYLGEIQAYWKKSSQQEKSMSAVKHIQDLFYNNGIDAHYCNYPDLNIKNWQLAYYGDSYAELQSFKKQHDPDNIIRHPQSILLG